MALDIIVQFVEGKIEIEEFRKHLEKNEGLVKVLQSGTGYSTLGNLYECITRKGVNDIDSLIGLVNVLGFLEFFLKDKGISFDPIFKKKLISLRDLIHDIQPSWLDLPGWYMDKMLKQSEDKSKSELKASLKAQILEDFKFTKKPRWIQSPNWLFVNERPLFFIGQIDISNVRHDSSQLYIFLDEKTNQFHFTEQSM